MAQIDLAAASAAAVTEGGAILQRARGIARLVFALHTELSLAHAIELRAWTCITGLSIDERWYFSYFIFRMAAWFSSSCVKSPLTEITRRHQKFPQQSFSTIPSLVLRFRRLKPLGFRTNRPETSSTDYVPMRQFQALIQPPPQKTKDPLPLHPLIG